MENLDKILTKKQYNIYKMKLEGHTGYEIAKMIGCSRQNAYAIIARANKKVDIYKSLVDDGMSGEKAIMETRKIVYKKLKRKGDLGGNKVKKNKKKLKHVSNKKLGKTCTIFIDYCGEIKTLEQWCDELDIKYSTAYARYRNGMTPDKILKQKDKIDYTIKEEYDLTLISDEYKEILVRKNSGESFAEIARAFGQTTVNVQVKAKAAIDKLNGRKTDAAVREKEKHDRLKNDEKYMGKKREDSRRWYRNHVDQERKRSRERRNKTK